MVTNPPHGIAATSKSFENRNVSISVLLKIPGQWPGHRTPLGFGDFT
jgi:hypothetical protein